MIKPHPRPPISPRLQQRLRILTDALLTCWAEFEGVEPYSELGRALTVRLHDLHLAIAQTQYAIEMHRRRRRGV